MIPHERVATIDIGTNTVLLLIAERRGENLVPIDERMSITRLGRDVDRTKQLHPTSVSDTLRCLEEYDRLIQAHSVSHVVVVGTSAMRDASGGDVIRNFVKTALHTEVRVLSGEEEARTTFVGSLSGLKRPKNSGSVAVVDVGGGSTEIVLGSWGAASLEIERAVSFDAGSVRMTERHVHSDPMTERELGAMRQDIATTIQFVARPDTVVGVAGTVTTLLAVHLAMKEYDSLRVHGAELSRHAIEAVLSRLVRQTKAERGAVIGLEPKRADVIVAGAECLLRAMDQLGVSEITVSDRGVRWGLAEAWAAQRRAVV